MAAAFDFAYQRVPRKARWLPVLVLLALLIPDSIRTYRATQHVESVGDFRGAYEWAFQHRREGDAFWHFDLKTYRIYYGKRCLADSYAAWQEIPLADGGRFWMVAPPECMIDNLTVNQIVERIVAAGWRKREERHFHGVDATLFEASAP